VRSREGGNFVVERFVLKKKREYEREEEQGSPVMGYGRTGASIPSRHVGCQPQ
jgi:hypothetical protein